MSNRDGHANHLEGRQRNERRETAGTGICAVSRHASGDRGPAPPACRIVCHRHGAGSASEHPYLAHTVAIAGKDQRLTRRIDARIERLRRRCEAVENTIVAEEDSRDRLVLSLRYLEGSSWREIGQRMGTGEDAARKRAERFFVRSQKSEGKNTGSSK